MKKIYTTIAILALFGMVFGTTAIQAQSMPLNDDGMNGTPCLTWTYNLRAGLYDSTTGGQVSQLQNFLRDRGYFTYATTGYFGSITKAAVEKFQSEKGLTADGYVGALTRAKILLFSCGVIPPSGTFSIGSLSSTSGAVGSEVIVNGFGFTSNSRIKFGTGSIGATFINANTLKFIIPEYMGKYCGPMMACPMIAQQVTPGMYSVNVVTTIPVSSTVSDPYDVTSNAMSFTVTNGTVANAPTITSMTPSSGPVGTKVVITGSGFTSDSTIKFGTGAIQNISYSNQNTLSFTIPDYMGSYCVPSMYCLFGATFVPNGLSQLVVPGAYSITITTPNQQSNSIIFTVTDK